VNFFVAAHHFAVDDRAFAKAGVAYLLAAVVFGLAAAGLGWFGRFFFFADGAAGVNGRLV
jgi:hypothetical protein